MRGDKCSFSHTLYCVYGLVWLLILSLPVVNCVIDWFFLFCFVKRGCIIF